MLMNRMAICNILTKQSMHSSFECQCNVDFCKVYLTYVSQDCLFIDPKAKAKSRMGETGRIDLPLITVDHAFHLRWVSSYKV